MCDVFSSFFEIEKKKHQILPKIHAKLLMILTHAVESLWRLSTGMKRITNLCGWVEECEETLYQTFYLVG